MLNDLLLEVVRLGALELRNVPPRVTNDEVEKLYLPNQPFLYASGNWGPGYVSIKGLVAHRKLFKLLVRALANKLGEIGIEVDFVAGNVTGGMIPGWVLSEELDLPYVYVRETRKKGGQKEIVTGLNHISRGTRGLVVEELVNFAESTCNSAAALRGLDYAVWEAATILYYGNPEADRKLVQEGLRITYLFTLGDLLEVAEEWYPKELVADYRVFLQNPLDWQAKRGLTPLESGGTR